MSHNDNFSGNKNEEALSAFMKLLEPVTKQFRENNPIESLVDTAGKEHKKRAFEEYIKFLKETIVLVDPSNLPPLNELNMYGEELAKKAHGCFPIRGKLFNYRPEPSTNGGVTLEMHIQAIKTDTLYLGSARTWNDPFDCKCYIDMGKYQFTSLNLSDKIELPTHDAKVDFLNQIAKNFIDGLRDTKGVCFSENHLSILMWAHYASNGKGFVTQYCFFEMQRAIKELALLPVIYDDERHDATDTLISYLRSQFGENREIDLFSDLKTVVRKSTEWSYENEWRYIDVSGALKKKALPIPMSFIKPNAIYLGWNISPENEEGIRGVCAEKEIDLFKMSVNDRGKRNKLETLHWADNEWKSAKR